MILREAVPADREGIETLRRRCFPFEDHIRPVNQVSVKRNCDFLRQLIQAQRVVIAIEVMPMECPLGSAPSGLPVAASQHLTCWSQPAV